MAEDNQNTEMEDILSSIKNILEDDEQNNAAAKSPETGTDVLDDVLKSPEVDDVLELSPDMRVAEDSVVAPQAEMESVAESGSTTVVLDSELGSLTDNNIGGTDAPAADPLADLQNDTLVPQIEPEVDSLLGDGDIAVNLPDEKTPAPEVEDILAADPEPVARPAEPAPVVEDLAPQGLAIEAESVEASDPLVAEKIDEIVVAPEPEPVVETEPEPIAESVSEPVVEPEAAADNAVDVSAGIISNFAKMFSHNETSPAEEPAKPAVSITAAGNTDKTLEQFVQDAVMQAIGSEIRRQWNNGVEFKSFAEAEVIRQTEKWLNENLPLLVEKIVKQEIGRVMAKVGS